MIKLITENQLDQWVRSNAREAQGAVVELIWRLVLAACPYAKDRRFPLGDSIGQHGPDGILDVYVGFDPFVPEGYSLWEIGTGLNPREKATSDYQKLTESVPAEIRKVATFIFITPLSGLKNWEYTWKKNEQAKWIEAHQKDRKWKDIRVIDGTRLIDWLHNFPAVELWLAQKICCLSENQIETPEQRWEVIKAIGKPPLKPEIFLINREQARVKIEEVFNGQLESLKLETHFPEDVVDFIAAYVASLDEERRANVASRCLIIRKREAWEQIAMHYKNHILIADPALDLCGNLGASLLQKAYQGGHRVIMSAPHGDIIDQNRSVTLPLPHIYQLQDALKNAGYSEERARIMAHTSGGNLGLLLKNIQGISLTPTWAKGPESRDLALAALIGSWDENREADCKIVEIIAQKPYEDWVKTLREIVLLPSNPLAYRNGKWKFISRYEAWYALGPKLWDEDLKCFHDIAIEVLGENNPEFDLPKENRFMADIYGKVFAHSDFLRKGIAETLALLGNHGKALNSCTFERPKQTAILAVHAILSNADWLRWASLDDVLPLLAESAPREFLNAIEKALSSVPCPFDNIFAQEGDALMGRIYMSGILWALETLAWDSDYLSHVVIGLGELANRDPGGHWANRPANSLKAILLPWLPQTCAPIEKRIAAVKTLLDEIPKVGWKLLLSLLPESHSVSSYTHRPAWRQIIPDDWSFSVTQRDYWKQVSDYADIAVAVAKSRTEKLSELINHLENLPPSAIEQILTHLESDAVIGLPETERLELWNKIVDLANKHKKFPDAQWVMPPDQIDRISVIADQLAPNNPFFRYQRLFSEKNSYLFEEGGNYEEQYKKLEKRREIALQEISKYVGLQGVLDFSLVVESPLRVGIAFGNVADSYIDANVLPALLDSEQRALAQFAVGFVRGRFYSYGWSWVDNLDMSGWIPAQIGLFFSCLPFIAETWRRVDSILKEHKAAYWSRTDVNPYDAESGLEYAVDHLIKNGRPFAAIKCLHKMLSDKQTFNNKIAVQALNDAQNSSESSNSIDPYEIVEIIKTLQNDKTVDPKDLFQIEWTYLPLLERNDSASPKFLEQGLATEPGFFCEIIRLAFPNKKDRASEEPTENSKKLAARAYSLLSEWRTPPGYRDDGMYDGNAFTAWLNAVKKEYSDAELLKIALQIVGQVLINAPPDPDGLWIHRCAAEALNAKDADHMRNGFRIALYNSRGVHWLDPTGKPERELAEKYRKQAEEVDLAGYPRFATLLRELAEENMREAERILSEDLIDE